jgi:uncharacterized protein YycO
VTTGTPADGRLPRTLVLQNIGPGYFGVVGTGGFVPWLIRRGTRSRYDHAFVTLGGGQIVEAEPGNVRVGTLTEYATYTHLAFSTGQTLTDIQRTAIAAKARSLVGSEYNFASIAELALADVGWHWRWLIRSAADDHDLDCSQLVAVCGQAGGQDEWACGKPLAEVTPADLGRLPITQPV